MEQYHSSEASRCAASQFPAYYATQRFITAFSNNSQQDAALHSTLDFIFNALHVSGGPSTHHQELKELYTQHRVL
jgi:hypothetical protein